MKALKKQLGFSLIEMIVSLGVFSVVITVAVGALLMLIGTNSQLQSEQSVMTNLSFALDSMVREIRTGIDYYCINAGHAVIAGDVDNLGDNKNDCSNGNIGIAFKEAGDSITSGVGDDRILYYFDNAQGKIYRKISNDAPQSIVSSGIFIEDAKFFVTGSARLNDAGTDVTQPTVTIFIEAKEADDPAAKTYSIETTVTQRTIDI